MRKEFITRNWQDCSTTSKVAMTNVSIDIKKGEVFGLLGPNGAGKSITLLMMIGEIIPTSGKIIIAGKNVRSDDVLLSNLLGFCPQHDALWDFITLEEHLRYFAVIKGIATEDIDSIVNHYVTILKLQKHLKTKTNMLSGAIKRKVNHNMEEMSIKWNIRLSFVTCQYYQDLGPEMMVAASCDGTTILCFLCYILSVLGNTHLVLIDEPSIGMSQQSKRSLWDTIHSDFHGTQQGAVITSQSMEEVIAICDRIGIIVNGQLECTGSLKQLKKKFCSDYILEIKLSPVQNANIEQLMDELESHLQTVFPSMTQVERFMERAQYSIPKGDVKSLGSTFAELENCKISHAVDEYSFSQSSLEKVYLSFARRQDEN